MEFVNRFTPLMSEALHFADTPEGRALSLEDIHSRLLFLAEEERRLPAGIGRNMTAPDLEYRQNALQLCRFAVYAWVDEQLLNSGREDAMAWTQHLFQAAYFQTASAGQLFFDNLETLLARVLPAPSEKTPSTTLAHKMSLATQLPLAPNDDTRTLHVYARCLLYGFRGIFYTREKELGQLLNSARQLLLDDAPNDLAAQAPPAPPSGNAMLRAGGRALESAAFIFVPLGVLGLFALFCASILANTPLPKI